MIKYLAVTLAWTSFVSAADLAMDSTRGQALFTTLSCVGCHSVNGQGGKIGPDLGNRLDRDFTPASLASTMWNHAPAMWTAMRAQGVRAGDLDDQAAAHLFAYFYAARFFERPGDAARGKSLFASRHCADCHGLTQAKIPAAKPVTQWESMSHPVALVAAMWNHAATMRQEFAQRKIAWPDLTAQDFSDILVYIRGLPGTLRQPDLLLLASSGNGEALFQSKGCAGCHAGKLALGPQLRGQTLTDIAVDMWNHAPRMGAAAPALNPEEMRDLTSYLWAQPFFLDSGNAAAGKRVFAAKRCVTCHEDSASGAPKLTGRKTPLTGAAMVSVLWRHGPQMQEQMKAKNIPWPRFDGADMANLIAYLDSPGGGK
jgi:mono/diheme cytochrome c family protein